MVLQKGIAHGFALLLFGQPAHGRLEEEDAKDGKQDDEFEDDQPHQRLSPGHVPEPVPVKGRKKGEYAGGLGHGVAGFNAKLAIISQKWFIPTCFAADNLSTKYAYIRTKIVVADDLSSCLGLWRVKMVLRDVPRFEDREVPCRRKES